tara:strand:+ start:3478 stop:4083 length:606 start_codon:yes stop_codon:yes gene_type:complete
MSKTKKFFVKNKKFEDFYEFYIDYLYQILRYVDLSKLNKLRKRIEKVKDNNGTIFTIGNGGSATTASHIATDFSFANRDQLLDFKCLSLCDNLGLITAVGNDTSFDNIFSVQLQRLANKKDLVIFISASGKSKNLINAAEYCKSNKIDTAGFLSFDGGELIKILDYPILFKSEIGDYGQAEDCHLILNHIFSNYFRFSKKK